MWAKAILPGSTTHSHYFNEIQGEDIDFTREQWPKGTIVPKGIEKKKAFSSTRDYLLSNAYTRKRYEILKNNVDKLMEEK